jgi:hypothetical protein
MSRLTAWIPVGQVEYDRLPLNSSGLQTTLWADRKRSVADEEWLGTGGQEVLRMPPVHVQRLETGRYRLLDGRHRLLACKLLGVRWILARFSVRFAQTHSAGARSAETE